MAAGDITAVRSKASDVYSAASFDGVDDFVQVDNLPQFSTNGFSISLWAYKRSAGGANAGRIFERAIDDAHRFFIDHNANVCINGTIVFSTGVVSNRWYNLVCTIATNGAIKIYFNGTLSGNGVAETIASMGVLGQARIGNFANDNWAGYDGCIKDFKIYNNKILSTAEITSLAAGIDIDRSNLVGEWKLQDNYNDTSGNGNHGTNTGTFLTNTLTNKIKADMQGMNLPAATDKIIALPRRGSPTIVAAKRTP